MLQVYLQYHSIVKVVLLITCKKIMENYWKSFGIQFSGPPVFSPFSPLTRQAGAAVPRNLNSELMAHHLYDSVLHLVLLIHLVCQVVKHCFSNSHYSRYDWPWLIPAHNRTMCTAWSWIHFHITLFPCVPVLCMHPATEIPTLPPLQHPRIFMFCTLSHKYGVEWWFVHTSDI